jgi:hypothetical protein
MDIVPNEGSRPPSRESTLSTNEQRASPQWRTGSAAVEGGAKPPLRKGNFAGGVVESSSAPSASPYSSPVDGGNGLPILSSPNRLSSAGTSHPLATTSSPTEELDYPNDVTADAQRDFGPSEASSHTHQLDASANARERSLKAKEAEVARLRRTVQELSVQLNDALHTLDARADASAELQAMKEARAAETACRDDAMRSVRLEMLESRVKYRTMEGKLAEKYNDDVKAKATELLATHTKEVHEKNFELLREKLLLAQEVTKSRTEFKELQERYKKLRFETDLDVDAKKQLLERSVQQKKQIAALREQVKTCEDNLNTVVLEYDKKLAEQELRHQAVANALTKERDDARRDALRLKRELIQLRSTAGNVMSQRSDMDDFFYAALDEVRRRAAEERRQSAMVGIQVGTSPQDAQLTPSFSPAQTATSLLRLGATGRLRITGSPGTLPTSSSGANWTLDRKGFPKRGPAGSSARQAAAASTDAGNPFSTSALPPVATTSRGARVALSSAGAFDGTGTLVSVPGATPAYLRTDAGSPSSSFSPSGGHHKGGKDTGSESAQRRSSPDTAAAECGAASSPNSEATQTERLPTLRSLPNPATWKDVRDTDIASLSWADKERVIQLLFKRIQEERRRNGKAHAKATEIAASAPAATTQTSTVAAEATAASHFDRDEDASTFLTQT